MEAVESAQTHLNNSEHSKRTLNELTFRQQKAIRHYLGGKNVSEIARKVGMGRTTFYNWLHNPLFIKALSEERDFLGKVNLDEAACNVVERQNTLYRQAVLRKVFKLLDTLPDCDNLHAQLLNQLDDIDQESGVSEA